MFKIVEKKSLNPTVSKITVEAPLIAKKAEPGQFIIFRAKEDSERIPLTIADFDREAGTVTIIYQIVGAQSETGLANMLYLVALLSVNVGFLNLLPIPAMDGGRIFLLLIELIKRKPVKPETENLVNTVGFILLLALMLLVTINDVVKLF